MRRISSPVTLAAVSLLCLIVFAACNCAPTLQYLTVSPATATINGTTTQQYTAYAYYSNGTITNVTTQVSWSTSNPSVATITPAGVATGLASGSTTISASIGGITSPGVTLTVNTIVSLLVTAASPTVAAGNTDQFTAMATYMNANGSTSSPVNVTTLASWSSSNTGYATVGTNTGVVTGVAAGTAVITAALDGLTATADVTVTGAIPVSIQISPATPTAAVGNATSFTAMEVWSDGTMHTPSGTVAWTSGTTATATIIATTPSYNAVSTALAAGSTVITATEGALTAGTATLTVVTGTAQFAYDSNSDSYTIEEYTVTASASPYLTPIGSGATSAFNYSPLQTVIHPGGQFMYVRAENSVVYVWTINSTTGVVSPTTLAGTQAGASGQNFGVIDPYGRFLYVSDDGSGTSSTPTIYAFQISPTDGSLTAVPGSPFSGSAYNLNSPECLIIDRTGSYLYATNYGSNEVSAYSIDQSTGALSVLTATPTAATGGGPWYAAQDPSGTHLYVADNTDNTVTLITIGTGGAISSTSITPPIANGSAVAYDVLNVAVDPSGKYLYVLDAGAGSPSGNGQVFGFNIGSGGAIGAPLGGTPAATGMAPTGIAIDPTTSLIAVDNSGSDNISLFTIGTGSNAGALTSQTPVTAGGGPYFVTFYNAP